MKNIVIGRFIPGNSFLYRMDPRTKIISLVILMVSAFVLRGFINMFIALGFIVLILLLGKISVIRVMRGLKPLMFLLLFTFTFQILFNETGPVLVVFDQEASWTLNYSWLNFLALFGLVLFWFFTRKFVKFRLLYLVATLIGSFALLINLELGNVYSTGDLTIHQNAVETGFFIMMRLIIIVTLSTILTLTTKPTDLNLGLESVLKPLSIIRINTEEMAMIIAIALRYIPTLLDEANKIMLAQASRGVDFSEGKMKEKVMQIVSLLVPMFIISFKRSDELANAMEARCFVPGNPRTRLHQLAWGHADTITIIISLLALASVIVIRVVGINV